MANVIFGNHMSVIVPRVEREDVRAFYCGVLGAELVKGDEQKDVIRMEDDFFVVLYGDVPESKEFLRTARSVWLEIKSGDVEAMTRKILDSGLARRLDMPDPHLYFQAPGGQCMRLVGIDEDLSFYEGAAEGPNIGKVKEALSRIY